MGALLLLLLQADTERTIRIGDAEVALSVRCVIQLDGVDVDFDAFIAADPEVTEIVQSSDTKHIVRLIGRRKRKHTSDAEVGALCSPYSDAKAGRDACNKRLDDLEPLLQMNWNNRFDGTGYYASLVREKRLVTWERGVYEHMYWCRVESEGPSRDEEMDQLQCLLRRGP